jgi:CheY-like chemotaxis protein
MIMLPESPPSPTVGAAQQRPRVLIVEDEGTIGLLFEDMLTDLGYEVGAVAARLKDGLREAETARYDCAILDVNLDGQPSYPIAEALIERGIPFLFVTGYGPKGLDRRFAHHPILAKPFLQTELHAAVSKLLGKT